VQRLPRTRVESEERAPHQCRGWPGVRRLSRIPRSATVDRRVRQGAVRSEFVRARCGQGGVSIRDSACLPGGAHRAVLNSFTGRTVPPRTGTVLEHFVRLPYIEDSPMMLPLLLSLVVSATDDPPVKVWLNHDNYFQRGDKARVNVKLADDGYLLVLRADAEGRVRVLFPLDPSNDNFVRGHETIEVRGRGDREAFFVDDREGSGLVLAARSTAPFKFDEFVRGDHWDYRVLDARQAGDDKE